MGLLSIPSGKLETARRVIVKVEFKLGEMLSRVGFIVTNLGRDSRVCGLFLQQARHGGGMDQRRQTGGEDNAAVLPLIGALHTDGGRVYVMVGREVKIEILDYLGSCAHIETNH
jgi:hypothetical protein